MAEEKSTIFLNGIRTFPKNEKQPETLISSGVISIEELKSFLDSPEAKNHYTQYNGANQLKFGIWRTKSGGVSLIVDTWKPNKEGAPKATNEPQSESNIDDLPF
jgi:hypothetical protein